MLGLHPSLPKLLLCDDPSMPSETIILVHGLWMTGMEMTMLKHRLETDHGYRCVMFSYASVTGHMIDHVTKLRELAQQQQCERLHFIGHSLGGVITYKLLESTNDLIPGRAVFMGSPLQGSRAVQAMSQWTLGRVAVGDAVCQELGASTVRHWDGRRDIGIVAGSANMGLGRFFSSDLANNSDGTVMIEETRLEGAADHIVLPVSHTTMVFSPLATRQVAKFLRDGKFDHQDMN
ncbi:MAG: alpha/beta hydrolase [Steroidobacteraceae bacterium]